jgi:hypothetical protein
MAKQTWTVKGRLAVEHQLAELRNKFGGESYLKNVEVKVSAREKILGIWGSWNSWGTDRTNSQGEFSVSKEKGKNDRQFRVEVKFQDDDLEIRHSKSTSSPTKVKWHTILDQSQERGPGTFDMGKRTFCSGGRDDLNDFEARRHADIWVLYQMAIEHMASLGEDYAFKTQIKVKYPHDGIIAPEAQEASYANPTTKVIYIVKNSRRDDFNTHIVLHELAHIWAYNHMSGEICLTETLLLNGSTHGLVDDHCVAFGEGFAEWWKDKMLEALFGIAPPLPLSRKGLMNKQLTSQALVQRHDDGWQSVFHMLTTPNLHQYDFGTQTTGSTRVKNVGGIQLGCESPSLGFKNVLKVFLPNEAKGYPKQLSRSETTIVAFLNRAEALLKKMTPAYRDLFLELADPQSTVQPTSELCKPFDQATKVPLEAEAGRLSAPEILEGRLRP